MKARKTQKEKERWAGRKVVGREAPTSWGPQGEGSMAEGTAGVEPASGAKKAAAA